MATKGIKGSSILEWSIILSVVLAALMAMQTYMQRGIQYVIKQQSDALGGQTEQTLKYTQSNSSSFSESKLQKEEGFNFGTKNYQLEVVSSANSTGVSYTQQNLLATEEE